MTDRVTNSREEISFGGELSLKTECILRVCEWDYGTFQKNIHFCFIDYAMEIMLSDALL